MMTKDEISRRRSEICLSNKTPDETSGGYYQLLTDILDAIPDNPQTQGEDMKDKQLELFNKIEAYLGKVSGLISKIDRPDHYVEYELCRDARKRIRKRIAERKKELEKGTEPKRNSKNNDVLLNIQAAERALEVAKYKLKE